MTEICGVKFEDEDPVEFRIEEDSEERVWFTARIVIPGNFKDFFRHRCETAADFAAAVQAFEKWKANR